MFPRWQKANETITKLIVCLMMSLLFSFTTFANSDTVRTFLGKESILRVYVSPAPGFGHQAATATVIKRLRQLGFRGEFEIVYAPEIAVKLATLFPGFDPKVASWQRLSDRNIKLVSMEEFKKINPKTEIRLGLTGADDDPRLIQPETLAVKNYLRLQPLGWGSSFLLREGEPQKLIPGLNDLGYLYEVDDSKAAIEKSISEMGRAEALAQKAAGLRSLLLANNIEIGSIYGVGLIQNISGRLRFWIESIQSAQRSKFSQFKGGVVVPIISGLNEAELDALGWEISQMRGGNVSLIDVSDPALPIKIEQLKKTEVLIVPTGRVSQSVFEILFKKSSVPLLLAGKNAMNLAQLLGKPFLNTVNDYEFDPKNLSQNSQQLILSAALRFGSAPASPSARVQTAKFILTAMDPQSEINKYFSSFMAKDKDKVEMALDFFIENEKREN